MQASDVSSRAGSRALHKAVLALVAIVVVLAMAEAWLLTTAFGLDTGSELWAVFVTSTAVIGLLHVSKPFRT